LDELEKFQKFLITLAHIALCGNRRQVIVAINMRVTSLSNLFLVFKSFKKIGSTYRLMLPAEKVQSRSMIGGLPFMDYFGEILAFYKDNVRPRLLKKGKQESTPKKKTPKPSPSTIEVLESSSEEEVLPTLWIDPSVKSTTFQPENPSESEFSESDEDYNQKDEEDSEDSIVEDEDNGEVLEEPTEVQTNGELQSFWIGKKGGRMGNAFSSYFDIQGAKFVTNIVRKTIALFFPQCDITPMDIRRMIVTHVSKSELHRPNHNKSDFVADFANLLNTSPAVSGYFSFTYTLDFQQEL
jgi:hypothetical protein